MEFSDAHKEPTLHENTPLEKIRGCSSMLYDMCFDSSD